MHTAKVPVVSLRPPAHPPHPPPSPSLSLHRNNLVTDDVKADKVQQLGKKVTEKRQRFLVPVAALHLSKVFGSPAEENTKPLVESLINLANKVRKLQQISCSSALKQLFNMGNTHHAAS